MNRLPKFSVCDASLLQADACNLQPQAARERPEGRCRGWPGSQLALCIPCGGQDCKHAGKAFSAKMPSGLFGHIITRILGWALGLHHTLATSVCVLSQGDLLTELLEQNAGKGETFTIQTA